MASTYFSDNNPWPLRFSARNLVKTSMKKFIRQRGTQPIYSTAPNTVPTGYFKTFWNIFTSVKFFCLKFCIFVGNLYPHISSNFWYICLNISSNGVNFSMSSRRFHGVKFWVLNADALRARTWWESHHFQWYPDKGWKLSTGKKVYSVDHTGSAVLCKPGSGTRRPATASACAICRCKTIFPSVGPTKL